MHLTSPDGSQSPEGQTGTETYERGGLRTASSRSWTRKTAILTRVQQATPLDHSGRGPARTLIRVREPAGGQTSRPLQGSNSLATEIGIRELLEAGVHFGHQTRGGIHIIDLQKTERLLHTAQEFAGDLAGRGGTILFVGTKKQARDAIKDAANSC